MDCSLTSTGVKKCVISCQNKQGLKPMNNDKVVSICRCTFPPKSHAERDGKCHWRVGIEKIIDSPAFPRDYVKNWFCTKVYGYETFFLHFSGEVFFLEISIFYFSRFLSFQTVLKYTGSFRN